MVYKIASILVIISTLIWGIFTAYGVFVEGSPVGVFMGVFLSPFYILWTLVGGAERILGLNEEDEQ